MKISTQKQKIQGKLFFVCVCEGKTRESYGNIPNGLTLQSPNLFHYLTEMYVEAYFVSNNEIKLQINVK